MRLKKLVSAVPLFVAPLFFGIQLAHAVEKYAIASDAKIIIVGKLAHVKKTSIAGGWRIEGAIIPSEVLSGTIETNQRLAYDFLCSCCPKAPSPDLDMMTKGQGLWFMIPRDGKRWTSAGSCSDPGWRPSSERSAFEAFITRHKR